MKIQKLNIAVADTESATLFDSVYDVAYVITDKKGNVILERNWLVEEIFTDPAKMAKAFYAKKYFTHYVPMLSRGEIQTKPWIEIIEQMNADFKAHNVSIFAAYNAGFDVRVMRATHKQLGYSGDVFSADLKILDIWQFACETKLQQKSFARIARRMGWVSDKGNIQTGAEIAHRYCSGDHFFIEDHTALSDARIEVEIMAECFRMKKRVPYGIVNAHPWRLVNKKAA